MLAHSYFLLPRVRQQVVVDGFSTSSGRYTLTAQGCPGQIVNQGNVACGINVTGNSATGTNTVGQAAPEHWYQFMAPIDGNYTFNTCGSSYDTWVRTTRCIICRICSLSSFYPYIAC